MFAIYEEEDALLRSGLPKAPDDLKGGIGFTRAGGHDEQNAILVLGNRVDRPIDGIQLVVSRRFAGAVLVLFLFGYGFLFG